MHIENEQNVEEIKKLSMLTVLFFGFEIILHATVSTSRLIIGNIGVADTILVYLIYAAVILRTFKYILRSIRLSDVVFLLLFIVLLFVATTYEINDKDVTQDVISTFVSKCIASFLIGIALYSINDTKSLILSLRNCSIVFLVALCIDQFLLGGYGSSHSLAYNALFCAMIFLAALRYRKNVWDIIFLGISFLLIIISNTMGAIVALLIALIGFILITMKHSRKKFVWVLFVVAFMVLFLSLYEIFWLWLQTVISKMGFDPSLIVEILEGGSQTSDKIRMNIYEYAWNYSKEHMFFGCGLTNDRVLITQNTLACIYDVSGNYPHNIFLEFMMQFGLIPGIIVSLVVMFIVVMPLIFSKVDYAMWLFLISIGFIPLMVSSSYLQSAGFYLMLGYLIAACRSEVDTPRLVIRAGNSSISF